VLLVASLSAQRVDQLAVPRLADALSLSGISTGRYVLATFLGIMPAISP
jgi:hypothetical protein